MSSIEKNRLGTSERRERIIQQLRNQGSVQVSQLVCQFRVSAVTIRNDLTFLEKQGVVTRVYGGALLCRFDPTEPQSRSEYKDVPIVSVKQQIGALAASLVQPGYRLILDAGTTTLEVARYLRGHRDIMVMTNGMQVANTLLDVEGVELLMTGGHLRRETLSFYGAQAEQSLLNYHFDMLFLGVDGIDLEQGVCTNREDEARLNRCMCHIAERVIVVAESSKFCRLSLYRIIHTQGIHTLVTDDALPKEILRGLRQMGIEVLLVPARLP